MSHYFPTMSGREYFSYFSTDVGVHSVAWIHKSCQNFTESSAAGDLIESFDVGSLTPE